MIVLAACIGLTWINLWQQHAKLATLTSQFDEAETHLKFHRSISTVVVGLDARIEMHRRALRIINGTDVKQLPASSHDEARKYFPANPRLIPICNDDTNQTVVIFSDGNQMGDTETVVALIEGEHLVDIKIREEKERRGRHSVSVEDANSDSKFELVFYCQPEGYGSNQLETRMSFPIARRGFGALTEQPSVEK